MGRGGYDTTDASAAKSLVAQAAINQHHAEQATAERRAQVEQAAAAYRKLIKSKKTRGIMAARRAAKQHAQGSSKPTAKEPAGDEGDA